MISKFFRRQTPPIPIPRNPNSNKSDDPLTSGASGNGKGEVLGFFQAPETFLDSPRSFPLLSLQNTPRDETTCSTNLTYRKESFTDNANSSVTLESDHEDATDKPTSAKLIDPNQYEVKLHSKPNRKQRPNSRSYQMDNNESTWSTASWKFLEVSRISDIKKYYDVFRKLRTSPARESVYPSEIFYPELMRKIDMKVAEDFNERIKQSCIFPTPYKHPIMK